MRALLAAAVLAGPAAVAAEVYVNGVNVEGLVSQNFEKVNVRIDEKGNVYIEAPGYAVKRVTVPGVRTAVPEGTITRRYYLVTEQTQPGATDFDIDVFLNGKFLRSLASDEPQQVSEVTRSLKPGRNAVVLQAKKRPPGKDGPRSTSKAMVFRVILGEGVTKDDQLVIEQQLVTFTRTAAEPGDVAQEFSFTTR
jgi:hypothetical protein